MAGEEALKGIAEITICAQAELHQAQINQGLAPLVKKYGETAVADLSQRANGMTQALLLRSSVVAGVMLYYHPDEPGSHLNLGIVLNTDPITSSPGRGRIAPEFLALRGLEEQFDSGPGGPIYTKVTAYDLKGNQTHNEYLDLVSKDAGFIFLAAIYRIDDLTASQPSLRAPFESDSPKLKD